MKPAIWGIKYVLRHHLSDRRVPLICGLVLTNKCNLRCRHCRIPGRSDRHLGFEEITGVIDSYYQEGGRCLYLHGGEPLLWRDELYIEPAERAVILRSLLRYKRRYRILNSRAGLYSALKNDWKRPLKICSVYEQGDRYECCRYSDDPELCRNCGYLSYAEIDQTLKLKPSAVLNALKYF